MTKTSNQEWQLKGLGFLIILALLTPGIIKKYGEYAVKKKLEETIESCQRKATYDSVEKVAKWCDENHLEFRDTRGSAKHCLDEYIKHQVAVCVEEEMREYFELNK